MVRQSSAAVPLSCGYEMSCGRSIVHTPLGQDFNVAATKCIRPLIGAGKRPPGERAMTTVVYVFTQENCPNCPAAKRVVREALDGSGIDVEFVDIHSMDSDLEFRLLEEQVFIASTPSIVLENDGSLRLLYSGEVPTVEDIRSIVVGE